MDWPDINPEFLTALPIFFSTMLTPIIVRFLGNISPPSPLGRRSYVRLRRRYGWVDISAILFFFGGMVLPFFLFDAESEFNDVGWPALGLGAGAAVAFPVLWILVNTLPFGFSKIHEFWLFYQHRYEMGPGAILFTITPFGVFGALSVVELWRRGFW